MFSRPKSLHRNRIRRTLDLLEDRAVPATIVDLATTGAEGTANGALLYQGDSPPAGAEAPRTFVRLDGGSVEQGYNTDARPVQFDEDRDATFTHSLTLDQVPVVMVDGVAYREFLLGVTERAPLLDLGGLLGSPAGLLSLDQLRIYVGSSGNLTGYSGSTGTLAGLSPVFNLDGAGDVTVKLNDRLVSSGGARDARILIPDAAFAGLPGGGFVYLYSRFGGTWAADDGFEQWAVRPVPPPPAPTGGSLSGYVYFDADNDGVHEPGGNEYFVEEYGLEGVVLHLTGTNDLGETVDLYATTAADGSYTFTGLRAGTYRITRVSDPAGFYDGQNTAGSAGGSVNESNSDPAANGEDCIFDIVLGADVQAIGYNFGQLEAGPPA